MAKIQKLEQNLINQIAAGEVIDRPSAVVKEMVENSIDSGATKIEVEVTNQCRNICISDNGCGINPEDIEIAFINHATSKILTKDDLWDLSTLGFRGEALASIASVSKVTCISKTKDNQLGTKIYLEAGEKISKTETGCNNGTIMEVKELFYNIPVRVKFLKSERAEYAHIVEILQNIAISHPEIAFTLKNEKSTSLKTSGSGSCNLVLSEIYSSELLEYLRPINKEDKLSNLKITGYAALPSLVKSNKKSIYIFINNRVVKCPILLRAVTFAYENLLPKQKFPFIAFNLDIPKNQVDVNVHPTKREVRYENTNQIFSFVQSAIKESLKNVEEYSYFQENSSNFEENIEYSEPISDISTEAKELKLNKTVHYSDTCGCQKRFLQSTTPTFEVQQEIEIEQSIQEFKIIGQYKNTYILIETNEGLQIIDQHIAHERYLYEELLEQKEKTKIPTQVLLISSPIYLDIEDFELIKEHNSFLREYGYKIDMNEENTQITFKQLPQIVAFKDPKEILKEIIDSLKDFCIDKIENKMLVSMSCQAAIKANTELSFGQMEDLIKKWSLTKNPTTCPHGRIISHTIKSLDIAGFFGRQK